MHVGGSKNLCRHWFNFHSVTTRGGILITHGVSSHSGIVCILAGVSTCSFWLLYPSVVELFQTTISYYTAIMIYYIIPVEVRVHRRFVLAAIPDEYLMKNPDCKFGVLQS